MGHPAPLNEILDQLAEYLEYEISEGTGEMEFAVDPRPGLRPAARSVRPGQSARRPVASPAPAHAPDVEREMKQIAAAVAGCVKCSLHKTRTQTVPGQGSLTPEIMFVGEAPGADEDIQGLAFVGTAGQLLTRMIEAMGYRREEVFIANILKCRPPENRQPLPEEMEVCLPYLRAQIALLKPRVIVALGAVALRGLLNLEGINRFRGKWLSYEGIDVMPTFHPSYLLRTPSAKKQVWEDLKEVLRRLGRPIPEVKKRSDPAAS